MQRALAGRDDVLVAAIMPAEPAQLRSLREALDLRALLLADPSWSTHDAYGFRRGSVREVWLSPPVWRAYARLIARGKRPRRPTQDVFRLGGDALVDREGRTAWIHRSRHAADRPPAAEIVAQLDRLTRRS